MIKEPFRIRPDERIEAIQRSLRCFRFAAVSAALAMLMPPSAALVLKVDDEYRLAAIVFTIWIPVLSLTLSLLARSQLNHAYAASQGEWNPARPYLTWGRILSALGIFASTIFIMLIFFCLLAKDILSPLFG